MERYKLLTDILLNKSISSAERDDAAMDLANFDEESVLLTLIKVAKDKTEDYIVLSSCSESFAEIILRRSLTNEQIQKYRKIIKNFPEPARSEAEVLINKRYCD